jgi:hypothetical protein
MCKCAIVCLAVFMLAGGAGAQVFTSGNAFVGYSYYHIGTLSDGFGDFAFNGWNASLEGKVLPWVGIVADFSGHYGAQGGVCVVAFSSGPCSVVGSASETNFLFGPRLSMSAGKVRLFGEGLFGAGRIRTDGAGSDVSFSTAVGGGLDYKIIRPIALRLEGDLVQTRFFGTTQNSARISTGIVVRF